MTKVYAILHMLVDGICALAMFGNFLNTRNEPVYFLLYNFCAFALQMPLGVLQDMLNMWYKEKQREFSFGFVVLGIGFTLLGAVTHPVVLGIGNALFHVGGGVGVIREDVVKGWHGRGLGVFVAPGALGLYLGTMLAKQGMWNRFFVFTGLGVLLLTGLAGKLYTKRAVTVVALSQEKEKKSQVGYIWLGISCFLVVIVRSYIGMAVSFPWKQVPVLGCVSVLAVVFGKAVGGFLAVRLGVVKATVLTLLVAAIGYCGLEQAFWGILALFTFNMTMPMTLYLLIKALPGLPGFAFGVLTFGLFLGFLPAYFSWQLKLDGAWLGCLGSLISMFVLLFGMWQGGKHEPISD